MTKKEYTQRVGEMARDIKSGYYGFNEMWDEIWGFIVDEQMRNKELWKEVKRLRKKLGIKT